MTWYVFGASVFANSLNTLWFVMILKAAFFDTAPAKENPEGEERPKSQ